jgi:hypothetical protein
VSEHEWNKKTIEAIRAALFDRGERTLLVQGGPGSGKTYTTISLALDAAEALLRDEQRALVLTFSVSAVDQIQTELEKASASRHEARKRVEITNYHAFYKRLLDAYGIYCGIPPGWQTWLPHEVEEFLKLRGADLHTDKERVDEGKLWELSNATCIVEGLMDSMRPGKCASTSVNDAAKWLNRQHLLGYLHYDSWPYFSSRILRESSALRARMSRRYPFIVIDEFQDTNGIEWAFIRELAAGSTLVCMMDPHQAVYEWKGACPQARLQAFCDEGAVKVTNKHTLLERPRSQRNQLLAEFADSITSACNRPPNAVDLLPRFRAVAEVRAPKRRCKAEITGYSKGEWPRTYVSCIKRQARQFVARGCRVAVLCPTWLILGLVSHALNSRYDGSEPLRHVIVGIEEEVGAFLSVLTNALAANLGVMSAPEATSACEQALEHMKRIPSDADHESVWFGPGKTPSLKVGTNRTRRDRILQLVDSYCQAESSPASAVQGLERLSDSIRRHMAPGHKVPIWLVEPRLDRHTSTYFSALEAFLRRNPEASPKDLHASARRSVDAAVGAERRRVPRSRLLVMTAHAAKGKEVDVTYVLAASAGTPLVHPRSRLPSECQGARNLLHVACSRSRERLIILHKPGEPCCILARLMGQPCPLESPSSKQRRRAKPASPQGSLPLEGLAP